MSPLAVRIGAGALVLLALIALRGKGWAYFAFALLGLLYFPAQTHFHVHAPKCEQLLPTIQQLVPLLHNYAYIALFAGFYWMSWVQFGRSGARGIWALIATLVVAALFEIAEGMAGAAVGPTVRAGARAGARAVVAVHGHCRVQDLVPAAAGALGAALLLAIWSRLTRKPAYVRLVRTGSAAAPRRTPSATPSPSLPYLPGAGASPRVPPQPVAPRGVVPPPPDFSPTPPPSPVAPAADVAPTEKVVRRHVQRLQAMLGRLRPILQRVWAVIFRRRRAVAVGLVVLVLAGAAAFVTSRLPSAAAPVVTAQADAPAPAAAPEPPPPPPPPLQSQVEGYYEPTYQFTISDRRFSRLTLRPDPFVTFSRTGTREQVGCEDARISQLTLHLRCELKSARMATLMVTTIDGQFTSRYATSRLDAPVLNAFITITNPRGEVLYRARESFYWHTPD